MRIAVVILNWNTEGFLEKFLPGLLHSAAKVEGAEVVVADNASTDGSLKILQEKFPQVKTLRFGSNLGFTGGYNKAFDELYCSADNPEYFLLINSDIEVPEDWLQPLVGWMDTHRDCGACAPKLHSWYERTKFEYAGAAGGYIDRFGYPFCRGRIMGSLEDDRGQYDTPEDVFWATGACLMVRSSVYRALGGLDGRFFAHMEEIDLCWRMQLHGWKVTVVPQSVVYHVGGGTLPATSPFKLYLNYRNNLLMLENNLAYTYALKAYGCSGKDGDIRRQAAKGIRKAKATIFTRMCMDFLSAAVYLVTGKAGCVRSVWNAHRDYRKMRTPRTLEETEEYLRTYGDRAGIRGIYRKWIVLQAATKGRKLPGSIAERDFYKI